MSAEERGELQAVISVGYDRSVSARAQMVLWRAEGRSVAEISGMAGASKPTVYNWIDRYEQEGLAGLDDRESPGRPRTVSGRERARILALTMLPPPAITGLTNWSSYEMAKYLKRHQGISVSHNFIHELWQENGLRPHLQGTFKLSKDPDFSAKVVDIVGLYLYPPESAVVLSFDEKTQVQALERTQPLLQISFGKTENRTHDYIRHGTTNLFAALEILTGKRNSTCFPRKRTGEFIKFMNKIARKYPKDQEIHVILDNLRTHNNDKVTDWLEKHSNFTFHYTPKGARGLTRSRLGSHYHQAGNPARLLQVARTPHQPDRRVHHALERGSRTIRVDGYRRQHPGQACNAGPRLQETRSQQFEIKNIKL